MVNSFGRPVPPNAGVLHRNCSQTAVNHPQGADTLTSAPFKRIRNHQPEVLGIQAQPVDRSGGGAIDALLRIGAFGFGIFIAVTSAAAIYFGVQAGNGWLAIFCGLLGCTMGLAGVVAALVARPLRSGLLGGFLVGIAARAVIDGGLYLFLFSLPVAAILTGALAIELNKARSRSSTKMALGGGVLALAALVSLALTAPAFPVICPAPITGPAIRISYPPSGFPWDAAEYQYHVMCPYEP